VTTCTIHSNRGHTGDAELLSRAAPCDVIVCQGGQRTRAEAFVYRWCFQSSDGGARGPFYVSCNGVSRFGLPRADIAS